MKQPKLVSLFETIAGTLLGFIVSFVIQYGICRYYGLPLSTSDNLGIIGIFTVASLVRGYFWRRVCEALHVRRPLSPFMLAAIAERFRQIEGEGWSVDHDDKHRQGDLALAGACYAEAAGMPRGAVPIDWPWQDEWWKPAGFRRDLVRAAALIIAEGERFDRIRSKKERRRA
ncbi:MAG: hypothetical protein KGL35_10365 [Bradyrhizobium sp.]|nr:hypothetical protein [Bradyrhizobium sp.]